MIDRELLRDMGFVQGTGWDHEVWVYEGMFWVHFADGYIAKRDSEASASAGRVEFFRRFIKTIEDGCWESAQCGFQE